MGVCHSLTCKGCGKAFMCGHRRGYCKTSCRKKPVYVIECKHCGKTHQAAHKSAKYCSATCAAQSKPIIVYWNLCKFCGNEFPSNPANTGRWLEVVKDAAVDKDAEFCSRECSVYARAFRSPEHRWLVQQQKDAARMLRQQHEPRLVVEGYVSQRGVKRVRKMVREWLWRSTKRCKWCGSECAFQKNQCSACRRRRINETKVRTHRKRCRKHGCEYHFGVTLKAVIHRDGSRCHWCGRNTVAWDGIARTFRTLDHVIPISKGGGHVMDNVVIACNRCNGRKRDKRVTLF